MTKSQKQSFELIRSSPAGSQLLYNKIQRSLYCNKIADVVEAVKLKILSEWHQDIASPTMPDFNEQPASNITCEIITSPHSTYYQGNIFAGFAVVVTNVKEQTRLRFEFYPVSEVEVVLSQWDLERLEEFREKYSGGFILSELGICLYNLCAARSYLDLDSLPKSNGFDVIYEQEEGFFNETVTFSKPFLTQLQGEKSLIFYAAPNKPGYVAVASEEEGKALSLKHAVYSKEILGILRVDILRELKYEKMPGEHLSFEYVHQTLQGQVYHFKKAVLLKFRNAEGGASKVTYYPAKGKSYFVAVTEKAHKDLLMNFLLLYPEEAHNFVYVEVIEALSPYNNLALRFRIGE